MSEDLSGLTLVELLDRLAPVPQPPPVSMWPQTAAWIWIGAAVVAALVWALLRLRARRGANAYRRAALVEIAAAGDAPAALAVVLRRAALSAWPRREVASLVGEDWLAFLDAAYGGSGFRDGPGRAVATAPYAPAPPPAVPGLGALAADWVRRHRRAAKGAP